MSAAVVYSAPLVAALVVLLLCLRRERAVCPAVGLTLVKDWVVIGFCYIHIDKTGNTHNSGDGVRGRKQQTSALYCLG